MSAAIDRAPNLSPDERSALSVRLRAWGERLMTALLGQLPRDARPFQAMAADEAQSRNCSIYFCWKRRFTKSNTNWTNRPTWARIPWTRPCASSSNAGVIAPGVVAPESVAP
ncbi:MAG: hypothetical protein WDN48_17130 [Pseudolabrys sp.]